MFWYYWILLSVICLIIESFTTQFIFIWFAISSLFASFASVVGLSNISQLIIFVIVGMLLLILLRTRLYQKFNGQKHATNSDALIGQKATIIKTADDELRAHVAGMDWKVRSETGKLGPGQIVTIKAIQGVTLIVVSED